MEIFSSAEFQRKPRGSTLTPLDLSLIIRAPQPYVKTKIYSDSLSEETTHLLLHFLVVNSRSLAFPELFVPIEVQLKRVLKGNTSAKLGLAIKLIIEKSKLNSRIIENKRNQDGLAPKYLKSLKSEIENENPLEGAFRLAKKVRDQKKEMMNQKNQMVEG